MRKKCSVNTQQHKRDEFHIFFVGSLLVLCIGVSLFTETKEYLGYSFIFNSGVFICCLHLACVCGVVFERGRARSTLYPVSFPLFLAPISGYVCMFTGVVVYHLFALGFIGHSPFSRKKEKENGNDFNPLGFFYS